MFILSYVNDINRDCLAPYQYPTIYERFVPDRGGRRRTSVSLSSTLPPTWFHGLFSCQWLYWPRRVWIWSCPEQMLHICTLAVLDILGSRPLPSRNQSYFHHFYNMIILAYPGAHDIEISSQFWTVHMCNANDPLPCHCHQVATCRTHSIHREYNPLNISSTNWPWFYLCNVVRSSQHCPTFAYSHLRYVQNSMGQVLYIWKHHL